MLRLLVESETQVPLLQSLTRPLAVNPQTRRYARNFLEEGTMSLSLEVDNITYVLGLRRYTDTTRPNINYCLTLGIGSRRAEYGFDSVGILYNLQTGRQIDISLDMGMQGDLYREFVGFLLDQGRTYTNFYGFLSTLEYSSRPERQLEPTTKEDYRSLIGIKDGTQKEAAKKLLGIRELQQMYGSLGIKFRRICNLFFRSKEVSREQSLYSKVVYCANYVVGLKTASIEGDVQSVEIYLRNLHHVIRDNFREILGSTEFQDEHFSEELQSFLERNPLQGTGQLSEDLTNEIMILILGKDTYQEALSLAR